MPRSALLLSFVLLFFLAGCVTSGLEDEKRPPLNRKDHTGFYTTPAGEIRLLLTARGGGAYVGTLLAPNARPAPLKGREFDLGMVTGTFRSEGREFGFSARIEEKTMILTAADSTFFLTRTTGDNPLTPMAEKTRSPIRILQAIAVAQRRFHDENPTGASPPTFAPNLQALNEAKLLDPPLPVEGTNEYQFVVQSEADAWNATATPKQHPETLPHFHVDQTGIIRFETGRPAHPNSPTLHRPETSR